MRISDWSSDVCSSDLPPIGEALALDAFQGLVHALHVLDTKGSALVVAEIELRQIALQVGRANMVVGAIDAALEQGEVALNGVGVGVAAHVLVNAVIDALMVGELGAEDAVLARVVARSEEHTSELQSLMRISYAVFCLKKKKQTKHVYIYKIHAKI